MWPTLCFYFFFKKRLTICHLVLGQCNSFRSTSQNLQSLGMKERLFPGSPSSFRHGTVTLEGIPLPSSKATIAQRQDKPPKFSSVNLTRSQLRVIGNGKIVSVASWTEGKEALIQSYVHVFMKILADLIEMRLTADQAEKKALKIRCKVKVTVIVDSAVRTLNLVHKYSFLGQLWLQMLAKCPVVSQGLSLLSLVCRTSYRHFDALSKSFPGIS